jgi:hypothetical protein
MFISSAMRLVEHKDGDAFCLLDKAMAEIIGAQDYPIVQPRRLLGWAGKPIQRIRRANARSKW